MVFSLALSLNVLGPIQRGHNPSAWFMVHAFFFFSCSTFSLISGRSVPSLKSISHSMQGGCWGKYSDLIDGTH